jgi:hypothetical protein
MKIPVKSESLRARISELTSADTGGLSNLQLATMATAAAVTAANLYYNQPPDAQTIADLQQASEAAQREAREGNKNNPAFTQKTYEIAQVEQRLESGQQGSSERGERSASASLDLVMMRKASGGGKSNAFNFSPLSVVHPLFTPWVSPIKHSALPLGRNNRNGDEQHRPI